MRSVFIAAFLALFTLNAHLEPLASGRLVLEILPSGLDGAVVEVNAEIASTPEERERGLMWRQSVPEGSGMIFIYPRDEKMSFWMKNTNVPLSIAFIDSRGVFREIFDMKPLDLTPVQSAGYRRFALEVPQGFFLRKGIAPGSAFSKKTLKSLKEIMKSF